jgi:hypothetical protein
MIFGQRGAFMKDLMGFCNKITPPNWHVTTRREQFTFRGPGTLNILVRIPDHFIDGWFYAFKKGSMNFYPVSLYTGQDSDALESLQIYGEHLVAESDYQGILDPLKLELNNYRYEMTPSVPAVH